MTQRKISSSRNKYDRPICIYQHRYAHILMFVWFHSFESFHFLVLFRWPEWFHFHRGVTPEAKFMISFNLPWKNISDGVNNRLEKMFSVKISLAESSPFWHSPFWHVPEGRIFNHAVVAWHWFTAKFCSNSFWSEGDEYFDALFFLIDSSSSFCFVPASVTTRITPLLGMLSRVTLTPGKSLYIPEILPWNASSTGSPPPPYFSCPRPNIKSWTSLVFLTNVTLGSLKVVSTQVGIFDRLSTNFTIISFTIGSAFAIELRKALVRKRTAKKMTLIVLKNDSRSCVNSKADRAVVFWGAAWAD